MPYLRRHGTMKPPLGAQLDPAHPFARNTVLCIPFNEGVGAVPAILPATGIVGTAKPPSGPLVQQGAPTWIGNREGWAGQCAISLDDGWKVASTNNWLPITQVTVLLIRRKRDTTNRAVQVTQATQGATAFWILVPWSDGKVYWDFGGNSGANRLSVALSYSTTSPDRMIFTAGPRGSAIWLNGVKLVSQATAITRTASADEFYINRNVSGAAGTGDFCDYNFFQIINDQWSDEMCRWWSAEPYDHLYGPPMTYVGGQAGLMAALSAASASSSVSRLGLLGVG